MTAKKKDKLPRKPEAIEMRPVFTLHPTFNIDVTQPPITLVIELPDYVGQLLAALIGSIMGLMVLAAWLG